jgi:hypothetical protein
MFFLSFSSRSSSPSADLVNDIMLNGVYKISLFTNILTERYSEFQLFNINFNKEFDICENIIDIEKENSDFLFLAQ